MYLCVDGKAKKRIMVEENQEISNEVTYDFLHLSGSFPMCGRDFKGDSMETRRKREGILTHEYRLEF